jgi:hypothetical protein
MAGVYLDEVDIPNLTLHELGEKLRALGVAVTDRQLYFAQWDDLNPLEPTKIGRANRFTMRAGLNWLEGQKGRYKAGSKSAARVAEQSAESA